MKIVQRNPLWLKRFPPLVRNQRIRLRTTALASWCLMELLDLNGWMTCDFYVLFNSISVILGRLKVDNERLCAMELCLQLRRFRLEQRSNSVH